MRRISKKYVAYLLHEDNYIDALAYFIERLQRAMNKTSDTYAGEDEYDYLDKYIWNVAADMDDDDDNEDWLGNALRIISALRIALDNC